MLGCVAFVVRVDCSKQGAGCQGLLFGVISGCYGGLLLLLFCVVKLTPPVRGVEKKEV